MSAGIFSYTWYQNVSKTFEATIGGSYQFYFLNLGGSLGYSYNTYSGHSLSAGGHVCVGAKEDEAGVCAGLEAGANMYWDAYGNFLGATAYAGPFAELQASDNTSLVKVNGGYETGLFGMEGRGWYTGVSAMDGSLYANWSQNGDWSYGFSKKVEAWSHIKSNNGYYVSILGGLYRDFDLTLPADGVFTKADEQLLYIARMFLDENSKVFTFLTHGTPKGIGDSGEMSASEFAERLKKGEFNYKNEKVIWLLSCNAGRGDDSFAEQLAELMPGVTVKAANAYVAFRYVSYSYKIIADSQIKLYSELKTNKDGDLEPVTNGSEKWIEYKK